MIPDEAVEAAKAAIWDLTGMPVPFEWQRDMLARAALESAAPYMLAGAKAEAWEAGFDRGFYDPLAGSDRDASESLARNPYA